MACEMRNALSGAGRSRSRSRMAADTWRRSQKGKLSSHATSMDGPSRNAQLRMPLDFVTRLVLKHGASAFGGG